MIDRRQPVLDWCFRVHVLVHFEAVAELIGEQFSVEAKLAHQGCVGPAHYEEVGPAHVYRMVSNVEQRRSQIQQRSGSGVFETLPQTERT